MFTSKQLKSSSNQVNCYLKGDKFNITGRQILKNKKTRNSISNPHIEIGDIHDDDGGGDGADDDI